MKIIQKKNNYSELFDYNKNKNVKVKETNLKIEELRNNVSFSWTYETKDNKEIIKILNYQCEGIINEEILLKVKILDGNQKKDLIFKKKFNKIGLHTIDFIIEGKLKNMSFLFSDCSTIKHIEFKSFDTSQVSNMDGMFQGCEELEYLDLSNFDTSNVENMGFIFFECYNLKEIKGINNFITRNVHDMNAMFGKCKELEYLDLSKDWRNKQF